MLGIAALTLWVLMVGLDHAFGGGLPPLSELSVAAILFYWATPLLGLALIFLCLRIGHPEAFRKFRPVKLSINEAEEVA